VQREAGRRARRARLRHDVVVPTITYPEQLPVSARRADIAAAIRDHQVVIVAGETGSGKTTQLPKVLLDLGRGRDGQIGHTQPRRIAARTVAERISEEITGGSGALGSIVGYQVRFTDQSSEETLVKVMTDGILLAQIQRDPQLLAYDTLIIDEAHERSLNIDFILGYLTRLLPQRPDLKLVITSATIDSARFARHFAGPPSAAHPDGVPAPVIEVTGRTYPVEIRYRPLSPDDAGVASDEDFDDDEARSAPVRGQGAGAGRGTGKAAGRGKDRSAGRGPASAQAARGPARGAARTEPVERDLMTALCDAVDELSAEGPGDILVFLSGEREIRDAEEALRGHLGPRTVGSGPLRPDSVEILPLYSRLSAAEQHRVFEPHSTRRVVLATNVAETSLTVPGVRYVIDPGTARISRFSKATKVQRLPIEPISQASANQRSGRCGRVADGTAIRLYSEADFASRPEFTEPEILRTSLASVILQMVAVGVASTPDDVAKFPFVEPPDVRSIRDGVQLLTELGALSTGPGGARLTDVGRALALLPMDPRLARMIVEGGRRDVAREVMIIAAALSIQDPRERPAEQRAQADQLHARFADPTSDFLTYLNLWHHVRDQQRELSGSAFRRMCKAEYLNYLRLREWQDVVVQLKEMAKPLGITVRPPGKLQAAARAEGARVEGLGGPAQGRKSTTKAAVDASLRERRLAREAAATAGAPGAAASAVGSVTAGAPTAGSVTAGAPTTGSATGGSVTAGSVTAGSRLDGTDPTSVDLRLAWDADRIHQSLLSGLLSHLGMQEVTEVRVGGPTRPGKDGRDGRAGRRPQARNEYLGARGARFAIFPGSPLSKKPPAWIMAGELVETSRLWARDVARVTPEWAEELAPHLVKRTYSEPAWSTKQGAAMANEKVLLYGVPIVAQRRVLFAKVDPEHARELFIRHALVQGEWTTHHQFFHENRRLLADAEQLENRARRRGIVVDDDALYAFYDERIPADVVSARHFDQWWKSARRADPELLTFTLGMLVADDADLALDSSQFPATWPHGDLELPLTYQFDPGTEADGVTVHIPLPVLNRVRPEGFDWLVPGMQTELATALIRTLPKPVRVQLVPAPDVARDVVGWIGEHMASWEDTVRAADLAPSFHEAFAQAVRALRDVDIPEDAWDDSKLPAHLRMTYRVHDERAGASVLVDEGSDLVALQRRLADRAQSAVRSAVRDAVRSAVREVAAAGRGPAASAQGVAPTGGTTTGGPAPTTGSGSAAGAGSTAGAVPAGGALPAGAGVVAATGGTAGAAGTGNAAGTGSAAGGGSAAGVPCAAGTTSTIAEQSDLRTWPTGLSEGRIPEVVSTVVGGLTVEGYPALVVQRGSGPTGSGAARSGAAGPAPVALRVLADASLQRRRHAEGVRELLLTELGLQTARITTRWSTTQSLTLAASPYPSTAALVTDLQRAAVDALLVEHPVVPADLRDATTYAAVRTRVRDALEDRTYRVAGDVAAVLTAAREVDAAVRATSSLALLSTVADVREQLGRLVHDGFVAEAGAARLPHLVRYLRGALHRLAKAAENPGRDEGLAWQVHELEDAHRAALAAARSGAPQPAREEGLAAVPWMLEELRVSLFAQHLGTAHPVSPKRIRTAIAG
jgi:ATP-dependent helicase HrpA